jgi:hypothetical protein
MRPGGLVPLAPGLPPVHSISPRLLNLQAVFMSLNLPGEAAVPPFGYVETSVRSSCSPAELPRSLSPSPRRVSCQARVIDATCPSYSPAIGRVLTGETALWPILGRRGDGARRDRASRASAASAVPDVQFNLCLHIAFSFTGPDRQLELFPVVIRINDGKKVTKSMLIRSILWYILEFPLRGFRPQRRFTRCRINL